jgi:hypothetical protein
MVYTIQPRTYEVAKEMNLIIHPSDNPKYKIEVYDKDGVFMFYGGASGYGDYPTYWKLDGKAYANERRRLYMIRHKKEIQKVGSRGYIIYKLLWS